MQRSTSQYGIAEVYCQSVCTSLLGWCRLAADKPPDHPTRITEDTLSLSWSGSCPLEQWAWQSSPSAPASFLQRSWDSLSDIGIQEPPGDGSRCTHTGPPACCLRKEIWCMAVGPPSIIFGPVHRQGGGLGGHRGPSVQSGLSLVVSWKAISLIIGSLKHTQVAVLAAWTLLTLWLLLGGVDQFWLWGGTTDWCPLI